MSMFQASPPRLPVAPTEYDPAYMSQMLNILNLFFQQLNAVQPIRISQLNIDVERFPTQADLANLRVGDIYRDSSAGNVLKIKV
jgi:hypothetical protein